jgi:hypothetical protein
MTLQSATTTNAEIITTLLPNDILLGRGAPIAYYEGNVRFRELIATRKMEYMSTGRHHRKREIAEQIFEEVRKRGGRFLVEVQMVNPSIAATVAAHARSSTSSLVGKVWKVAEDCVALEKVKQTLREKHSLERGAVLPMATASSDDVGRLGGNDETKAADGRSGDIVKAEEIEAAQESASELPISIPPSKEMAGNETEDGSTRRVLEERKVDAPTHRIADSAQNAASFNVEPSGTLAPAPPVAMLESRSSPASKTPSTNPALKALSGRGKASQGQQHNPNLADALLMTGIATAPVDGPTTMELPCAANVEHNQRSFLMNSMALEIMRQQQQQAMRDQQQQQVTLLQRQRIAQLEWQLLQQHQAQRDQLALSQAISALNASAPVSAGLMSFQAPQLAPMSLLPAGVTAPATLAAGWPVTLSTNNASSILDNLLLSSAPSGGAPGAANGTLAMRPSPQDPPRSFK